LGEGAPDSVEAIPPGIRRKEKRVQIVSYNSQGIKKKAAAQESSTTKEGRRSAPNVLPGLTKRRAKQHLLKKPSLQKGRKKEWFDKLTKPRSSRRGNTERLTAASQNVMWAAI